mmetsp:Transcript_75861/g.234857  ORF Transcript_75861/g.234857 Transcript_75861/m.234857 type:complete len:201 (+) Transcript_75861:134-736(+)
MSRSKPINSLAILDSATRPLAMLLAASLRLTCARLASISARISASGSSASFSASAGAGSAGFGAAAEAASAAGAATSSPAGAAAGSAAAPPSTAFAGLAFFFSRSSCCLAICSWTFISILMTNIGGFCARAPDKGRSAPSWRQLWALRRRAMRMARHSSGSPSNSQPDATPTMWGRGPTFNLMCVSTRGMPSSSKSASSG